MVKNSYLGLLYGASAVVFLGYPAQAQAPATRTPGFAIEEIVVTAQRREQNLQDVPASVSAIGGERLERTKVTTVNRLNAVIPNFQVAEPFGASGPGAYTIRGISSTDFSHNQSRPIAISLDDGVRQLPTFEFIPLFDIERVEVLRGPQGALYGKNATGGAVKIITKAPDFDLGGHISAGYGNFDRIETEGAIQAPIVDDVLAARVAYTYVRNDGVIKNRLAGIGDLDQTDMFGIRGSLLFKPNSDFDALLRINHTSSTGATASSLPVDVDFAGVGFTNIANAPGVDRSDLGYFENRQNQRGDQTLKWTGANLQLNWSASEALAITSVTTYDEGKWVRFMDGDGLPLTLFPLDENARGIRQFVQELRASGELDALTWLIGGFYSRDRLREQVHYSWMADPVCGAQCDLGIGGGGIGLVFGNSFTQKRESYAVYARGEYELVPTLTLALGARYSWDELDITDLTAFFGDSGMQFPTIGDPAFGGPAELGRTFKKFTGEVVVSWQAHEDVQAYASFKQGYRSGAFNAFAFVPEDAKLVPPETANSYEVGIKSDLLNRRVTFNISGFLTDYKNQQVISAEMGFFPLRSIPKARIWGIEADLRARLLDNLSMDLSASRISPKYRRGTVSNIDISENQITNAAKWMIQGGFDWMIVEIGPGAINLHGDAAYQSRTFFDVLNTPSLGDSGHIVANAQLSYNTERYDIELWATNLFDEKYQTYGVSFQEFGFSYVNRGMPREYGVRLNYRF